MSIYRIFIGLLLLLSVFHVGAVEQIERKYKKTAQVTKSTYAKSASKSAVILMAVNWGRQWGCREFENAQLTSLAFDLVGDSGSSVKASPDLYLESPSRLFVKPVFTNYAFILPPGIYGLSHFTIKAAKSISEVGYLTADRSDLYVNNKPEGGTFEVKAGEIVYIGNFWLDCAYGPVLWRYYSTMDTFADHLKEYSKQYKFIPVDKVQYRLFSSNVYSNPSDNLYGQEVKSETP